MTRTNNKKRELATVFSKAALICLMFLGLTGSALVPVVDNVVKDPNEVPPAINRDDTTTVNVNLVVREVIANLSSGKPFYFWTYNGTVPGPMVRVMEGDTVVINLTNDPSNNHSHNIDFHAVMGPGGGGSVTNVAPGETKRLIFKAKRAGAYVYHCAAEGAPWEHVSHGMYGLIMVEPKGGLGEVDRELYVAQGEWYLNATPKSDPAIAGPDVLFYDLDAEKARNEHPDLYTFNGHTNALKTMKTIYANQNDKVRLFFATGGPDIGSNFHVIGQIFDKAYTGHPDSFTKNEETVYVAPGDAAVFEFKTLVPGKYLLVDHALWRASKGASGFLNVNKTSFWPFDIYDSYPRIFS